MHTHLERGNPRTGHCRHLLVTHPLHMLQDKRLTLFGRQRCQRALDQRHLLISLEHRPGIRAVGQWGRIAQRDVVRVPPSEMTAAAIARNPVQPAAQPRRIPTLCQMPISAHETLGNRIRRGIGIPEHARREAKQTRLVSPDENPKRLPIAAQDPGDHFDIRGPVVHHHSDPPGGGLVTVFQGFRGWQPGTSRHGHRRHS